MTKKNTHYIIFQYIYYLFLKFNKIYTVYTYTVDTVYITINICLKQMKKK